MILPGCFAVILFPVIGALMGHWLGGPETALTAAAWGLGGGLALLLVLIGVIYHIKKG